MSHTLSSVLVAISIMSGFVTLALVIGSFLLIAHKREQGQRVAERKSKEITHIRNLQAEADLREHQREIQRLQQAGSISGTIVAKGPVANRSHYTAREREHDMEYAPSRSIGDPTDKP